MKVTLWLVILCLICMSSGIVIGVLMERQQEYKEVITKEIHLIIPKPNTHDLRNQLLHISAQKSMLDELMKWEQKLQSQHQQTEVEKRKGK